MFFARSRCLLTVCYNALITTEIITFLQQYWDRKLESEISVLGTGLTKSHVLLDRRTSVSDAFVRVSDPEAR